MTIKFENDKFKNDPPYIPYRLRPFLRDPNTGENISDIGSPPIRQWVIESALAGPAALETAQRSKQHYYLIVNSADRSKPVNFVHVSEDGMSTGAEGGDLLAARLQNALKLADEKFGSVVATYEPRILCIESQPDAYALWLHGPGPRPRPRDVFIPLTNPVFISAAMGMPDLTSDVELHDETDPAVRKVDIEPDYMTNARKLDKKLQWKQTRDNVVRFGVIYPIMLSAALVVEGGRRIGSGIRKITNRGNDPSSGPRG